MMWQRLLALLALCASLSLSAQSAPSPGTASPPLASSPSLAATAQSLADDSTTLAQRLAERKTQAEAQVRHWQSIVDSLIAESENAKNESAYYSTMLQEAEAKLALSQMALAEISTSLDASRTALASLQADFDAYRRTRGLELWIWRGATVAASVLAVLALVAR